VLGIDRDPAAFRKFRRLLVMGGSIARGYGDLPYLAARGPASEYNIRMDIAAARKVFGSGVPIVLMHNRAEPHYRDFVAEFMDDMRAALARAIEAGVPGRNVIIDPGFGFGKTPAHNLIAMRELANLRALGRPILLGTSRKSTIGRILGGLPPEDRLEGTLATTALGIAAGVDIIRVHDVRANLRAALVADAICRGTDL